MAELRTEAAHIDDGTHATHGAPVTPVAPVTPTAPGAPGVHAPSPVGKTYDERVEELKDELIVLKEAVLMQNAYRAAREREGVIRRRMLCVYLIVIAALLLLQLLLLAGARMGVIGAAKVSAGLFTIMWIDVNKLRLLARLLLG